jgi:hypothetical protein
MTSPEQDIQFLMESLPQLQAYLLSNELYWPLSGSLPRLTLGSLLLALARMDVVQPESAEKYRQQVEIVRAKWRMAWEKKAVRETANRLRLWSQFLLDYVSAPEQYADSYPTEARGRAILQLLLREAPDTPEKATLAELDAILKPRLASGGFLWENKLQAAFPENDFWFLYGTPALSQNGKGGK